MLFYDILVILKLFIIFGSRGSTSQETSIKHINKQFCCTLLYNNGSKSCLRELLKAELMHHYKLTTVYRQ